MIWSRVLYKHFTPPERAAQQSATSTLTGSVPGAVPTGPARCRPGRSHHPVTLLRRSCLNSCNPKLVLCTGAHAAPQDVRTSNARQSNSHTRGGKARLKVAAISHIVQLEPSGLAWFE